VWLMVNSEEDETRLPAKSACVASNSVSETTHYLIKSMAKWVDMLLISML